MESPSRNFGVRLRSLIERKGVTIAQFAKDFGLAESQAHNWLGRDQPPLAKHWPRLAAYFGVSESYVATGAPGKSEVPLFRGDTDDLPSDPFPPGAELKPSTVMESPPLSEVERATVRAGMIRTLVRTLFRDIYDAAGADLEKLGWLKTQMLEHLTIPPSWGAAQDVDARIAEIDRKFEAIEREAAARQRSQDSAKTG